jgi:hypothetical protein
LTQIAPPESNTTQARTLEGEARAAFCDDRFGSFRESVRWIVPLLYQISMLLSNSHINKAKNEAVRRVRETVP